MTKLSDLLVTRETFTSSMYREFLGNSKYSKAFWDDFKDEDNVIPTDMTFIRNGFSFVANQTLESLNVIDPEIVGYEISECFVTVEFSSSGSATIFVSANGGVDWEEASNNTIHTFAITGTDLRIRFVAGGIGSITNWALLYKPDAKSYVEEMESTPKALGGGIEVYTTLPVWAAEYSGIIGYVPTEKTYYAGLIDRWVKIVPSIRDNLVSNSEFGCWSASTTVVDLREVSNEQFSTDLGAWEDTSENSANISVASDTLVLTVVDGATTDIARASLDFGAKGGWFYAIELFTTANDLPLGISIGDWIINKSLQPTGYSMKYYFSPKKDGELLNLSLEGSGVVGPFTATIDYAVVYECGPIIMNAYPGAMDGGWSKTVGTTLIRDYIRDGELPETIYCVMLSPFTLGGGEVGLMFPSDVKQAFKPTWLNRVLGKTLSFGSWVYATANIARINIVYKRKSDGVLIKTNAEHSGDGTWQWLEVTSTIPSSDVEAVYAEYNADETMGEEIVKVSSPMFIIGEIIGEGNYRPKENDSPVLDYEIYLEIDGNLIPDPWEYKYMDLQALSNGRLPSNIKSVGCRIRISDTSSANSYYCYIEFYDETTNGVLGRVTVSGIANGVPNEGYVELGTASDRMSYYPNASGANAMKMQEITVHKITLL